MAASDEIFSSEARTTRSVQEFVDTFKLPRLAKVVGGESIETAPFKTGDFIYLHTLAVDTVYLSFYDTDAGLKREVRMPADSNIKFQVLQRQPPPRKRRGPKVYHTVADILEVCPTRFQANIEHDDPYLPVIFKKGEQFRFLRRTRSITDRQVYLECEDASGNVLKLPRSCHGDFSIVDDQKSYTLQEIISIAPINRTLKLSDENVKLVLPNKEKYDEKNGEQAPFYGNILTKDSSLSGISGLPLTYKGNIHLKKPDLFILASPQENIDVKWKIPLDLEITLLPQNDINYEEPVPVEMKLSDFVVEFEPDFPVVAEICNSENISDSFRKYLKPGMEVLIHNVEKVDKLLCKTSSSTFFCLSEKVGGSFRPTLKKYHSLADIVSLKPPVMMKIMQDIASDVPEPFSLSAGDVLLFKSFNIQTLSIKLGRKTFGKTECLSCEKMLENNSKQKLVLPSDLDVVMIHMPKQGEESGFGIDAVFSRCLNLPATVDYLPSADNPHYILPTDEEIFFQHLVSDHHAVVTPLPHRKDRRKSGLDARMDFCLLIPLRYDLKLRLKTQLQFPTNYFIFPRRDQWISVDVETLTVTEYEHLVRYNDQAYEDYCFSPPPPQETVQKDDSKYKILRRKGRSLSELQIDRVEMDKLKDLRRGSESDLAFNNKMYDDENIYELFEPAKLKKGKGKSDKSLTSRIRKRVSKIF